MNVLRRRTVCLRPRPISNPDAALERSDHRGRMQICDRSLPNYRMPSVQARNRPDMKVILAACVSRSSTSQQPFRKRLPGLLEAAA